MQTKMGSRMKKFQIVPGVIIWILLFLIYCSRNANNPIGSDFFERDSYGSENHLLIYPSSSDTFFQIPFNTGNSSRLYFGKYMGRKAYSLIKFANFQDSGSVDSAFVKLYIDEILGAKTGSVDANIYIVQTPWEDSEMDWNTLQYIMTSMTGQPIDTVRINADDDSICFFLPPATVEQWLSDKNQDYGFLITSEDDNFMVKLFSEEANSDSTPEPNITIYMTVDTTKDTLQRGTAEDVSLIYEYIEPTSDRLVLSTTTGYCIYLSFNLDSIPEKAILNRAVVHLTTDTSLSFPDNQDTLELKAYPIYDPDWSFPSVKYNQYITYVGSVYKDSAGVNITHMVQTWIKGIEENYGLVLKVKSENKEQFTRFFFSTSADSALMPRLDIYYTLPPSSRF